jgi:hypothetical protein
VNTTVFTGNNGGPSAALVPYSSRTFYLCNNAVLLATSTATSSCASGTTWNGSTCAGGGSVPKPSITNFSPNPMTASTLLIRVTVTGNNFQSGTEAHLLFTGPTGLLFSSADHPERFKLITPPTQWQYDMNNNGAKGTWHVQVVNPDGQYSNSVPF